MHAISYQFKRGHLANVRRNKELITAKVPGMTPARFDILCFLRQMPITFAVTMGKDVARKMPGSEFQKKIVQELALHKSVISRMLKALEELGWIARERYILDPRYKVVHLTKLGLDRIWRAMRILWRQRPLLQTYEKIARGFFPDRHVLDGLDVIFNVLDGIARALGDSSAIWYDFGSRTVGDGEPPPPREWERRLATRNL